MTKEKPLKLDKVSDWQPEAIEVIPRYTDDEARALAHLLGARDIDGLRKELDYAANSYFAVIGTIDGRSPDAAIWRGKEDASLRSAVAALPKPEPSRVEEKFNTFLNRVQADGREMRQAHALASYADPELFASLDAYEAELTRVLDRVKRAIECGTHARTKAKHQLILQMMDIYLKHSCRQDRQITRALKTFLRDAFQPIFGERWSDEKLRMAIRAAEEWLEIS